MFWDDVDGSQVAIVKGFHVEGRVSHHIDLSEETEPDKTIRQRIINPHALESLEFMVTFEA